MIGRSAGIEKVTLVAMIGKLAKFAAGQESVYSTAGQQDFAFLACLAQDAGASQKAIDTIKSANTAQEVAELMVQLGSQKFFALLCQNALEFGRSLVGNSLNLEIILTANDGTVLSAFS